MRRYSHPALRGALAGVLALVILLLLDFAPQHLVAYGQTAGPLPTSTPIGAVAGLAVVTVGDVLAASNHCTGANQVPILASQHVLIAWNTPGQAARMTLDAPVTINLPIPPSLLAAAGGVPARLFIQHALPDGTVIPVAATILGNGTTAAFQSSELGDFYAVALPAGLPALYSGRVAQVNLADHTFVLAGQNVQFTVQSTDRQGGTVIVHQDGSSASFNEIPSAPAIQVAGLPSAASCGKPNTVAAKQITLTDRSGLNEQVLQLPSHLPATGLGGMATAVQ